MTSKIPAIRLPFTREFENVEKYSQTKLKKKKNEMKINVVRNIDLLDTVD